MSKKLADVTVGDLVMFLVGALLGIIFANVALVFLSRLL